MHAVLRTYIGKQAASFMEAHSKNVSTKLEGKVTRTQIFEMIKKVYLRFLITNIGRYYAILGKKANKYLACCRQQDE